MNTVLHRLSLLWTPATSWEFPRPTPLLNNWSGPGDFHDLHRFDNLIEWQTELRKCYIYNYSFIMAKRMQIRISHKKRCVGWGQGGSQMASLWYLVLVEWGKVTQPAHWCVAICRVLSTREDHSSYTLFIEFLLGFYFIVMVDSIIGHEIDFSFKWHSPPLCPPPQIWLISPCSKH